MREAIKDKLISLADEEYRKFSASLLPGTDNILGVRLPLLRKLAKELTKGDWRGFLGSFNQGGATENHGGAAGRQSGVARSSSINQLDGEIPLQENAECFEEIMLQGMVIGYAKLDVEERLRLIAGFVPKISNWSVCDSFCTSLDFTKKHKDRVWEFLMPYFNSNSEYELRFAAVMLLNYYIEDEYIDKVLFLLDGIKHEGYYVKMAVAWTISVCYVKHPDRTMKYLKNNNLDDFTYNKAIQKIIESNRINKDTKDLLRKMKRK